MISSSINQYNRTIKAAFLLILHMYMLSKVEEKYCFHVHKLFQCVDTVFYCFLFGFQRVYLMLNVEHMLKLMIVICDPNARMDFGHKLSNQCGRQDSNMVVHRRFNPTSRSYQTCLKTA